MPHVTDHPRIAACPKCGHPVKWPFGEAVVRCKCKAYLTPDINGMDLRWSWMLEHPKPKKRPKVAEQLNLLESDS